MADVKFTGLPASSGVPDNGSVCAISTYDGVSAYTSEKYTMSQLKDLVYVMENGDKISAFGNGVVIEDESGTQGTLTMNGNTIQFDNNGGGYNKAWFYGSNSTAAMGFGQTGGGNGTSFHLGNGFVDIHLQEVEQMASSVSNYTTPAEDLYSMALCSREAVLNGATRRNSLALGGVGVTIDKDDYAFCENLEIQGGNLIKTASSTPASASATGTTGQIEWDSDYIYVCTATNTWKRAALTTW